MYTNTNAYLETDNNGIYNVYTVNGPSIVKFGETLSSGKLSVYVTIDASSGRGGVLFGATALENLTNSATNNKNANYYYWYVNASGGGWILYKVNNGVSTNINDIVGGGTAWATFYGSAWAYGTYLFEVELESTQDGLSITLSVDGHEFLTYTDTEPLTGTQTGYLLNANNTARTFYAISVTQSAAAEAAAQNSLNAVADLPRKD